MTKKKKVTKKKKLTKKEKLAKAQKHYDEGEKYAQQGDADEAIECWKKTVELNPDHFDAWYNLGNAFYMGNNDWENAFKCW